MKIINVFPNIIDIQEFDTREQAQMFVNALQNKEFMNDISSHNYTDSEVAELFNKYFEHK